MATNQILGVTFRPVADDTGGESEGGHAMFIALELADPGRLIGFLEEIVTRFKRERLSGPADARFMLMTLAGTVSAADFAQAWHASIANDAAARALLGAMHQADVMQSDPEGRTIAQASLLASQAS